MIIKILYFAHLRERLGQSEETLDTHATDLAALRLELMARGRPYSEALAADQALRCALNQQLCSWESPLVAGAEVAFFPPVTGG